MKKQTAKTNLDLKAGVFNGYVMQFELYDYGRNADNPVCIAHVTNASTEAIDGILLWFIVTSPGYQRRGYGKILVNRIKERTNKITTSKMATIGAGKKLMKACGFKAMGNSLVWEKQISKGGQNGKLGKDSKKEE